MNAALPALRGNTIIQRLEAATALLAEADLALAHEVIAVGKAAEEYARAKGLGEEAERRSRAVTLKAERKLGELLKETPKNEGGRPTHKTGSAEEPVRPTLAELGIGKKESMLAQQIADLPAEKFDDVVAGKTTVRKAIAEAKGKPAPQPKPKAVVASREVETLYEAVKAELAELKEKNVELADVARELNDKLTMFETTEPDEQQKLIASLQKKLVRKDAEIERLTLERNRLNDKCNQLMRQVKMLEKKK